MINFVLLLAAAALVSVECGIMAHSPRIENGNTEIDNNLQSDPAPPTPRRRGWRKYVSIKEPPPETAKHAPGIDLELKCMAMGAPAPVIQWLRNGQLISEFEHESNELFPVHPSSFATTISRLIISEPSPNRKDVYTCLATSGAKRDTANTVVYNFEDDGAYLQQLFSPMEVRPRVVYWMGTLMQAAGSRAVLPCGVRASGAEIYWTDGDDRPLPPTGRVKELPSGDLLIADLRWEDMGEYKCVAKNLYGTDFSSTFLYPVL